MFTSSEDQIMGYGSNTPRLKKHWESLGTHTFNQFTAAGTVAFAGAVARDEAFTVLRMIGEYAIAPGAAPTAFDSANITVGICVISTDSFAAGGAAIPDPAAEPGYPWLYWADHGFQFGTTSLDPAGLTSTLRHGFDIRSMRKVKPSESVVMVAEYVNGAGNPALDMIAGITRVLIGA